jgi:hypothetical protein
LSAGGYQPHAAADIFAHRYGDCKDNATLLGAMLSEIGVNSYYVVINTERGAVTPTTPPNLDFNHIILAIALPMDIDTATLSARTMHPKLGQLLFFDPTDGLTPFGKLSGELQGNYGLLVALGGGELIELPQLPPTQNGVARVATMTLDEQGTLSGNIDEVRVGGRAT